MNKKGQPRHGGRAKGTPNKKTQDIMERLEALGCDPIEGMARIALGECPCPVCKGAKKQKYLIGPDGPYVEVDKGTEMSCLACYGTGKEPIPAKLAGEMYRELAQYVAPKRKAIEHSGQIDSAPQVNILLHAPPVAAK